MSTVKTVVFVILLYLLSLNDGLNIALHVPDGACGAAPRVRCDGTAGENVKFCYMCSAAAGLGNEVAHPGHLQHSFRYFTRQNVRCPQGVPGTGAGGAGAVTVGVNPGEWVINWAPDTPGGIPTPFEKEQMSMNTEGVGLIFRVKREIWRYKDGAALAGDNPCAGGQVAGVCRYRILPTSDIVTRPRASAKQEYNNLIYSADNLYNLMADYEYDVAVEEARENRAIALLKGEKKQILRLRKEIKKQKHNNY